MFHVIDNNFSSSTGRFLQEDSYTGDIKDSLSLNLYTYCENEPIRHDDPTGHFMHIAIGAGIGAVVGAASFIGNAANQYITNKIINWKEAGVAGVVGAFGELGGKILGKVFSNTKAGKAILGKVDNVVSSLKNKLSAVKEKVAQTAEKSLSSITSKLNSFNRKLAVEGMNISFPSKAFNGSSGMMNIGKNLLKAVQDGEVRGVHNLK